MPAFIRLCLYSIYANVLIVCYKQKDLFEMRLFLHLI